jgi:hypothetical protein
MIESTQIISHLCLWVSFNVWNNAAGVINYNVGNRGNLELFFYEALRSDQMQKFSFQHLQENWIVNKQNQFSSRILFHDASSPQSGPIEREAHVEVVILVISNPLWPQVLLL